MLFPRFELTNLQLWVGVQAYQKELRQVITIIMGPLNSIRNKEKASHFLFTKVHIRPLQLKPLIFWGKMQTWHCVTMTLMCYVHGEPWKSSLVRRSAVCVRQSTLVILVALMNLHGILCTSPGGGWKPITIIKNRKIGNRKFENRKKSENQKFSKSKISKSGQTMGANRRPKGDLKASLVKEDWKFQFKHAK